MPKKSKDIQKESVVDQADPATDQAPVPASFSAWPKKKVASRKTATKKSSPARKRVAKKAGTRASRRTPTDDEVSLRAYFLAERRVQLSLPGNSDSDWLEARRQLFEEAGLPLN